MLGSGSIIVADDTVSIPHMALRTARFYHHESCGKCTPCREGTNWTVKMLERVVRGEATPMDLDIVASVQENIIGHCLCVLGDSMAMPVGAMVQQVPRRVRGSDCGRLLCSRARLEDGRRHERDNTHHRRARGDRDRGRDAPRRGQAGRRRDPGLLLRAEARRAGRRLPDVPGRDRGDPETADLLLDAGPRRDGRPHPHRAGQGGAERGGRVPPRQPPARLPGLRQRRRVPAAGHHDGLGAREKPLRSTTSATSRSRSSSRRWSRSTASAASSATAASASARRSPRTRSCSCSSAATAPSSAPSTTAPTSRPSTATSPTSARSGR